LPKSKTDINIGIPVEELYFEPNYMNMPVIYQDRKKKFFSFQNYDGKVGVYPVIYPSFRFIDAHLPVSETATLKPKKTESCGLCGEMIL
jgi:hypothetical protein